MRITMLETRKAALDGVNVQQLEEGQTYEVPDELAARYLNRGLARNPKNGETVAAEPAADKPPTTDEGAAGDAPAAADDPIAGLNAKQAAKKVAELTAEQLDAIPEDEDRKGVLDAIAKRRDELAAAAEPAADAPPATDD